MLQNLRDTGGHLTRHGERLRTGVLFRGDAPIHLDDATRARLAALGLTTIIDLRRGVERERRPSELGWFGGRVLEISLVGDERRAVNPLNGGLAGFNHWLYRTRGGAIAEVVAALGSQVALPALVHCSAGKDRTGLLVGLIHSWLGVPDDVVAEDYARSAELLHADTDEAIDKQQVALGVNVRDRPDLLEARPEWIVDALEEVRRTHGGAGDYLIANGAHPDDLGRLRAALVDA
ncbi:MAG: protein-tyrosine phosphatase [Solirubrobacteraceae bacterium]|jgi:protein-tyrosine phosphatase|nr:protein-tyrosine phosphatase [Solirubrobacteraceae bacterium]